MVAGLSDCLPRTMSLRVGTVKTTYVTVLRDKFHEIAERLEGYELRGEFRKIWGVIVNAEKSRILVLGSPTERRWDIERIVREPHSRTPLVVAC